jgi:hypothetical protein
LDQLQAEVPSSGELGDDFGALSRLFDELDDDALGGRDAWESDEDEEREEAESDEEEVGR